VPFELHPKKDFISAAFAGPRPKAFLVGSPLSTDGGGGVPGIGGIVELVRAKLRGIPGSALADFEASISGLSGADAYQAAAKHYEKIAGRAGMNQLIEDAVLHARLPRTPSTFAGYGDPKHWYLPRGTRELGELISHGGERFAGPIFTTNFDPLISAAIRQAGGRPGRIVLDGDGAVSRPSQEEDDERAVVHLHGYWRDADSLHTLTELTKPRPRLKRSLQEKLRQRTLVVVAYSGWDDVFTNSLKEVADEDPELIDVIWCFRESDASAVADKYQNLLANLKDLLDDGRFRAFGGIDCHSIFGELLTVLRGATATAAVLTPASPLAGWEQLDAGALAAQPALTTDEVVRFFDGGAPAWRHAVSLDIPRRSEVALLAKRLNAARTGNRCSLHLIRGAGGEGKTTVLMQAAADAAHAGGWNVLWRSHPRTRLVAEDVARLDSKVQWLIAADEAENLVRDLVDCTHLLHSEGRSNVHFLLAAQDIEWRHAKGDQQPWRDRMEVAEHVTLRSLSDPDIPKLLDAWEKYGADGLRALAAIPDAAGRRRALRDALAGKSGNRRGRSGSFFGGLLDARFDAAALRTHINGIMAGLRDKKVEGSTGNEPQLFNALLYIAACERAGIPGLDDHLLADLVGVPRHWVQRLIVRPLGEEVGAGSVTHTLRDGRPSVSHVYTRHHKVADAILIEAEQSFGIDLGEVWADLIRQTVRTSASHPNREFMTRTAILNVAPKLYDSLPGLLSKQRRREIALAAAQADIEVEHDRLSPLVGLAATYRAMDDAREAVKVFETYFDKLTAKTDYNTNVRGFWYEWGNCLGSQPDRQSVWNAAWLQGISISDHFPQSPINNDRVKQSCAGLGFILGKLLEAASDQRVARGHTATTYIGRLVRLDPTTAHHFNKHAAEADVRGLPYPPDLDEAIGWLQQLVFFAGQHASVRTGVRSDNVHFTMLRAFCSNLRDRV
jgi:hypothetical protein